MKSWTKFIVGTLTPMQVQTRRMLRHQSHVKTAITQNWTSTWRILYQIPQQCNIANTQPTSQHRELLVKRQRHRLLLITLVRKYIWEYFLVRWDNISVGQMVEFVCVGSRPAWKVVGRTTFLASASFNLCG